MKNKKLFFFPKVLFPIVTLMLMTSAILFSMKFFISGRMELSDRRNALILATARMADINYQVNIPEDGLSICHEFVGDSDFTVKTAVLTLSENECELSVEVTSSSGERVELVRRFYLDYESENEIEIKSIYN